MMVAIQHASESPVKALLPVIPTGIVVMDGPLWEINCNEGPVALVFVDWDEEVVEVEDIVVGGSAAPVLDPSESVLAAELRTLVVPVKEPVPEEGFT